ncbi:MAG: phage holin family protein [Lachnospiraceae bacterium]|nr:phage holin family protein [Lachnospiraceae bacterium]
MQRYMEVIAGNQFVQIVILWIVFDTILGCLRAVKHHKFNSAFGIDGGIRKVAMIVSVAFLMLVDLMVGVNVISWLPDALRQAVGLTKIGVGEFFCILFILYESVSILKNLYLCGCPTPKWLKTWLEKFLEDMTGELEANR